MKIIIKIFLTYFLFFSLLHADLETYEGDETNIADIKQDTLFVSLGSYCAPAAILRALGLRKAAFPFDWNVCLDGEKLIEILKENFSNFLNLDYLVPHNWAMLLHTYYHMEFVHDGFWTEQEVPVYMPLLQEKYTRRIERFRKLNEHQGKVFFIRSAYVLSLGDKNFTYKVKENLEISEDYTVRLYDALRDFFPKLDFALIIINNHEYPFVKIEKKLSDSIWIIRASPAYNEMVMQYSYEQFFYELLLENKQIN